MKYIGVAVFFGFTIGSLQSQTISELKLKAGELYEAGKYDKAAKVYEKLVGLAPDTISFYNMQATCLCDIGKLEDALAVFNAGLKKAGGCDDGIYLNRGNCFHMYRYYDKAVQDFTDGLQCAENDTIRKSLYMNRAASRISYMDVRGSLEDNLMALSLDPNDVATHNNIGMTYGDLKEYDKAEFHLNKVIELDADFPGGLMNLGFLYSEMEKYSEALQTLDKALEKHPDEPYAYNNRGFVKFKLGMHKEALTDIEKSLKIDPTNSYAYRNMALVLKEMGKMDKACEMCLHSLKYGFSTSYGSEMEEYYKNNCTK